MSKIIERYTRIYKEDRKYRSNLRGPILKDIPKKYLDKIIKYLDYEGIPFEKVDISPGNKYITIIVDDIDMKSMNEIIKDVFSGAYIWYGEYNK